MNMDYVFKKFDVERIKVQRKSKGERKILTVYLTVYRNIYILSVHTANNRASTYMKQYCKERDKSTT